LRRITMLSLIPHLEPNRAAGRWWKLFTCLNMGETTTNQVSGDT
jgi:hypothetical protein